MRLIIMRTILCYGDSNVRGVTPEPLDERTGLTKRYIKSQRWTGVMQNERKLTQSLTDAEK